MNRNTRALAMLVVPWMTGASAFGGVHLMGSAIARSTGDGQTEIEAGVVTSIALVTGFAVAYVTARSMT